VPVVHVRSLVPPGGEEQIDDALASIANAVASAIDGEPSGTWCTFAALDRMSIGDRRVTDDGRIVYVDIWMRSRGPELDRAVLIAGSTSAAQGFGVPLEDVWSTLRDVDAGRVMAGGEVVEG
jgi:hypothetical protein